VWGRPLLSGGRVVTAELAGLAVDQCTLIEERFTLIAPDDYRQDLLEIALFEDEEADQPGAGDEDPGADDDAVEVDDDEH
jgi:hypothetical protein